ncbi:hypothetical protein [Demequina sp. NBRC 110055]|uniref:hypothetical protein n=1 Tax=Demequina sp. NBRC 110055 TaxID=1570344 RepID=UPI0009FEF119|nr:hypothetical protein [Demequina sp. NBRC 110055]
MTITRAHRAVALVGLTAVLLAGCSTSDESEATASAETDIATSAAPEPPASDQANGFQRGGVSGEIAYVADGTAQVQDDSSQTAVRFTDDTTVTTEVEIALTDFAEGQCVVVLLGDDDAATSVSVSEPDEDGTCATGFGGMGGERPTGDMPEGMERPTDGDIPSDMPTAMPEGMEAPEEGTAPQGQMPGGFAGLVTGTVSAVSDGALTVDDEDGEPTEVSVADDATVTGTEVADTEAIEVGLCMTAMGEADSSGGYDATSIALSAATAEGCTTGLGGRGGFGGGAAGGGMGGDLDQLDTDTE